MRRRTRKTIACATVTGSVRVRRADRWQVVSVSLQDRRQGTNRDACKRADTLAEARVEAERLRKILAAGEDPKIVKRVARAAKGGRERADVQGRRPRLGSRRESRRKEWSADYIDEVEQSLRNHLYELDGLPVSAIVASITAPILHTVEVNAPAMEEKVARRLHAIMDYAVELGAIERNPLPRRRRAKREQRHFPAVTDLPALGAILRAARASDPCKGIQRAHMLLAYHRAARLRSRRRDSGANSILDARHCGQFRASA